MRFDLSLLRFVCCIVETAVSNKNKKGKLYNKLEMVILAYTAIYNNLSEADKIVIKKNIENLHTDKLIKAVHWFTCLKNEVWNFLKPTSPSKN